MRIGEEAGVLAVIGASETFLMLTLLLLPYSWHTHLLLRKAPTCTLEIHMGWFLCISVDINNHLYRLMG